MPSHESAPRTLADAHAALLATVANICERSFFTVVESCDAVRFAALSDRVASTGAVADGHAEEPTARTWLKASIAFEATLFSGAIEVHAPEPLARWLMASLLGMSQRVDFRQVQVQDDLVFDSLGEFANMLCGAWLTELTGNLAFDLGSPAVMRLPADWNPARDISSQHNGHYLCINELPMRVLVTSSRS